MLTDTEIVGEDHARNVLESERAELLLLLAVRIHHAYGLRTGSCSSRGVLEAADEAFDEDWTVHFNEYDYVTMVFVCA